MTISIISTYIIDIGKTVVSIGRAIEQIEGMQRFLKLWIFRVVLTPNRITDSRIVTCVFLFWFLWLMSVPPKDYYFVACLFVYAYVSDFFDGAVARANNMISPRGKSKDRFADKFLILILLKVIFLFSIYLPWFLIVSEIILFIFIRIEKHVGADTSSGDAGKMKFVFQGLAIIVFLSVLASKGGIEDHPISVNVAKALLIISYVYAIYSIYFHWMKIYAKIKTEISCVLSLINKFLFF